MWKFEIGFLWRIQDCAVLSVVPRALLLSEVIGSDWCDDHNSWYARDYCVKGPPTVQKSMYTELEAKPPKSSSSYLTAGQESFSSTGCDRHMLTEALPNL